MDKIFLLQNIVHWLCFEHDDEPLLFMTGARYTTVIFQEGFQLVVVGCSTKNSHDRLSFSDNGPDLQVCTPESVHTAASYRGNRGIAPLILNLGTKWRWVVNFTTLQLYFQERTCAQVEQETGWYPEPVWTLWEKESSFFLILEFEFRAVEPAAQLPYRPR
jgi:hypothetical protein